MEYRYRSLAVDAASGAVTPVCLSGPGIGECRTLTIRGRAPITLPRAGISLRAGVRNGRIVCAWRDTLAQEPDGRGPIYQWVEGEPTPRQIGLMYGSWCAFGPDGLLYVLRDPCGHYTVHDADGTQIGAEQQGPTDATGFASSGGLWYVDEAGVVYSQDVGPGPWYGNYNGVTVYHPRVINGNVAGSVDQEEGMPPRPYLDGFGSRLMWNVPTDHAIEFAVDHLNRPYVAISGPGSPEPDDFSGWVPYAPYVEPPVVLPDIVIPPQRPAWIVDTEGIVTPRGNGISTSDGAGPKFFEDALWVRADMEDGLEAIYWGPEPCRGGLSHEIAFKIASEMALRNRIPVCVNDEWGYENTRTWLARFIGAKCQTAWTIEAYRPAGQSQDDYRASLASRLAAVQPPYAIVAPLFEQQGGGSELEACATLQILQEELAKLPTAPIVIDLFGLRRPPVSAWRINYASHWIAKTPQPASLRQPVVVVPPPPKPPGPIVIPGRGHNADSPVIKQKPKRGTLG